MNNFFNMFNKLLSTLVVIFLINTTACVQREAPPCFTARVINVYKEEMTIANFKFLYWWEERGETPFLKPHTYAAQELIVEVMIPDKLEPNRVAMATERIPLQQLATFTVELTESGKDFRIRLRDGRDIVATTNFPRTLKKEPENGLADFKVYAVGEEINGEDKKEFKLDLNFIKHIEMVSVTAGS